MKSQWVGSYFRAQLTPGKDPNEFVVTKAVPLFPAPSIFALFVVELDIEREIREAQKETY
jgi:hypothetical protein